MDNYTKQLEEAASFIRENDDFLVISHLHPDGDATGSSLAVAHLLHNLGKRYIVANEGSVPKRFSFLTGYEQLINFAEEEPTSKFSTIIAVDIADFERFGGAIPFLAEERKILNIDHHPTNTLFGLVNIIRSTAASTTEILYDLIQHSFSEQLDTKIAEALYTGLLTDTGGFRYSNTTESVLQMAATLLKYGIKPSEIAEYAP